MREIKFRGKRADNGEWVYGDLMQFYNNGHRMNSVAICSTQVDEVLTNTVGQFTGLHDKNGKDIYEGDILSKNGYIWGVYFEVGAFFISKNGKHDPYDYGVERLNPYTASDSIVLTNIHDNPELLNQ